MITAERLDGRTLACIAIALLTWSSAYASIAYALAAFTPGEITLARLGIASICFATLVLVRREALPARRDWPQLALLGVIGLTVYHTCLNVAETRIASGTASILISLVPAATAAVSALWLHERLSARMLAGLAVALVGVVLVIVTSGREVKFQPMALLVLVSVVASAIYFVGQKPLFARNSMLGVTAFTFSPGRWARCRSAGICHRRWPWPRGNAWQRCSGSVSLPLSSVILPGTWRYAARRLRRYRASSIFRRRSPC